MFEKKYIMTKEEVLHLICKGILIQRTKEDAISYVPYDLAVEVFVKENL